MNLEILTPDKNLYTGQVKSISLPGADGSLGILDNHAPLISSLKKGTIKLVDDKEQTQSFDIKGGVVEVLKNKVIILAE